MMFKMSTLTLILSAKLLTLNMQFILLTQRYTLYDKGMPMTKIFFYAIIIVYFKLSHSIAS